LVFNIKGGIQTEGVCEQVAEGIFGPKGDEVTRDWRKLHNEELHNIYSSPNIIRIIKSRRMRLAEHVARMREKRNIYIECWWDSQKEIDH
jgi:hypothetical protein